MTTFLLNLGAVGLTLSAVFGALSGLDINVMAFVATLGLVCALADYWRHRPPGWPRNARW